MKLKRFTAMIIAIIIIMVPVISAAGMDDWPTRRIDHASEWLLENYQQNSSSITLTFEHALAVAALNNVNDISEYPSRIINTERFAALIPQQHIPDLQGVYWHADALITLLITNPCAQATGAINALVDMQDENGDFITYGQRVDVRENIWATIALRLAYKAGCVVPKWDIDAVLENIKAWQADDGGFDVIFRDHSRVLITAEAIIALSLSSAYNSEAAKNAIEFLHSQMNEDFTFSNATEQSYAIIALALAGEDIFGERWANENSGIFSALTNLQAGYSGSGGGFYHNNSATNPDDISTRQAITAMSIIHLMQQEEIDGIEALVQIIGVEERDENELYQRDPQPNLGDWMLDWLPIIGAIVGGLVLIFIILTIISKKKK